MGTELGTDREVPEEQRIDLRWDEDAIELLAALRGAGSPPPSRLVHRVLGRARRALLLRQAVDLGVEGFVFGFLRNLWPRATGVGTRSHLSEDVCDDLAAALSIDEERAETSPPESS